jgi:low affinity Fe/Cu permease
LRGFCPALGSVAALAATSHAHSCIYIATAGRRRTEYVMIIALMVAAASGMLVGFALGFGLVHLTIVTLAVALAVMVAIGVLGQTLPGAAIKQTL